MFDEIHLWCYTCRPLDGQLASYPHRPPLVAQKGTVYLKSCASSYALIIVRRDPVQPRDNSIENRRTRPGQIGWGVVEEGGGEYAGGVQAQFNRESQSQSWGSGNGGSRLPSNKRPLGVGGGGGESGTSTRPRDVQST